MLITEEYKKMNAEKHKQGSFGIYGIDWANTIMDLCKQNLTQDVLDYGCGQSMLAKTLPFKIQQYDPAIPVYSKMPVPADVVICTDVLEHIEPECIDSVLQHLRSLTKKMVLLEVSTVPAMKTLPDGSNCHRIIQPYNWWLEKLLPIYRMLIFNHMTTGFMFIGDLGE